MRWIKIVAGIVGVFAIVVVGVVLFVATLDLNDFRAEIEGAVAESTGRTLRIDGDLNLAWTPRPTLTTETVHFANADWGSKPDMATVGRLEAAVEVIPLLSGRLDVQRIVLSDVTVLLERDGAGLGNWEIAGPGRNTGGLNTGGRRDGVPLVRSLELADVTVLWKESPEAAARTVRVDRLSFAAANDAALMDVSIKADLDGDAVELEGTLPALAEALRPGATLPVDLKGTLGGQDVAVAANLRYAMSDAGAIASVSAERLAVTVGDLAATGMALVMLDGPRPRIEADLRADRLVLPEGEPKDGGDPLDDPLRFELLDLLDGKLTLAVASLLVGELEASDVHVTATLDAGLLTLDPASATVSEGEIAATAVVDAAAETPRHTLTASWRAANFGKLARTLHGSDTLEATGDARVDLTATGVSVRDMVASLAGVAWITVKDGRIANEDWELIGEDLTNRFLPFLDENPRGALNCAVGRWTLKRGVAQTAILMIDSDRVIIAGEGSVDLARETIDMKLLPSPKDASLINLATPLIFTGDLRDPTVAPDPLSVAKGIGSVVAGTAIAGPFALLLPFMSSGSDEPACPQAIAIANGSRSMPASGGGGTTREQEKPGGIKGLFDSLRRAVE